MPAPNPDIRRIGGQIGARRRWQPGSSDEQLMADLEVARTDDLIDRVVARAPQLTPVQAERLRRIFNAGR